MELSVHPIRFCLILLGKFFTGEILKIGQKHVERAAIKFYVSWISIANYKQIKSQNNKINFKMYVDFFFGEIGTGNEVLRLDF